MKRKDNLKTENLKTIDPAVLEEILGGAQVVGDDKRITVIAQVPFSSFFHS
jgi:hypothetical protein